jgi:hypothetical protein
MHVSSEASRAIIVCGNKSTGSIETPSRFFPERNEINFLWKFKQIHKHMQGNCGYYISNIPKIFHTHERVLSLKEVGDFRKSMSCSCSDVRASSPALLFSNDAVLFLCVAKSGMQQKKPFHKMATGMAFG